MMRLEGKWACGLSLVLGVWLFISAFVWPHAMGERTNAWIVGALIGLASAAALAAPSLRYLNTMFAVWLFIATLFVAHQSATTVWNNLIVAIAVFALSLSAGGLTVPGGRREVPA